MSLSSIITRLVESSGRRDLTTSDWIQHAQRACRTLDSKAEHMKSFARSFITLGKSQDRVTLDNLRAVEEVWLHTNLGRIRCDLHTAPTVGDFRDIKYQTNVQTEFMEMLGLSPTVLSVRGKVYCLEMIDRSAITITDKTVVARVNLTNALLTVAAQPSTPSELLVIIEDGLLFPQNPALLISAGTVTIVGTDKDGAALTEIVDCSAGAGEYRTTNQFKTVTSVTTAAFNYLTTGDEKITVKCATLEFLSDLDTGNNYGRRTLIFYPTITETCTVEVIGLFWSETLSALSSSNYWTEQEPDALEYELCRRLEIPLRNREGLLDWKVAVDGEIERINQDFIEAKERRSLNTMRG